MPTPNPDYNPGWEALHDHHDAERTRLSQEIDKLTARDHELYNSGDTAWDSPERQAIEEQKQALQEQRDVHQETCLRCLDTYQHETVQDKAKWLLTDTNLNVTAGTDIIHQIDFEQFTTMQQVTDAFVEARDYSKRLYAWENKSLSTGRPEGKDIFEETGSNVVASQPQFFTKEELYPQTYQHHPFATGCDVLLHIDQREGEYHVCLTQDNDMVNNGHFAIQAHIERLATMIYYRVLHSEQERAKTQKLPDGSSQPVAGELSEVANANVGIEPSQFHFYLHHPAEEDVDEQFIRMDLDFRDGMFEMGSTGFNHCDVIPAHVQDSYRATQTLQARMAPKVDALPRSDHLEHIEPRIET